MKLTQEQVIAWAREAGFEDYDSTSLSGHSDLDETLQVGEYPIGESVFLLATIVYEAGRKDEREWQGLTDDEIMDACSAVWASHPIEVGQVVAAILKEKNGF